MALAGLVTIGAVAFAATRGQEPEEPAHTASTEPRSGAVVQVDPEREPPILKSIPVPVPRVRTPGVTLPTSAHSMVVGQGGVWTVRFGYLFHVDPSRSEVRERLTLEFGISFSVNLAEGSDKIWVAYDGGLDEVNPATGEQREAIGWVSDRRSPTTSRSARVPSGSVAATAAWSASIRRPAGIGLEQASTRSTRSRSATGRYGQWTPLVER